VPLEGNGKKGGRRGEGRVKLTNVNTGRLSGFEVQVGMPFQIDGGPWSSQLTDEETLFFGSNYILHLTNSKLSSMETLN
jgi:hypothetical protein